jgi:hypothetical protein
MVSLWRDETGAVPPYDTGLDSLFVCYSGSEAELDCHMALGWPLPCNVVDLITEYRLAICGKGGEKDLGLFAALARVGVPLKISAEEKEASATALHTGMAVHDRGAGVDQSLLRYRCA